MPRLSKAEKERCHREILEMEQAKIKPYLDRITELENENKVLTQNLEDTEIINAELKAELSENKVADCHIVNGLCEQLTNAKEIIKQLMKAIPYGSGKLATEAYDKAEHFLKETK